MPYSLRKDPTLRLPKTHSFYCSANGAHFRGSIIWYHNKRSFHQIKKQEEITLY